MLVLKDILWPYVLPPTSKQGPRRTESQQKINSEGINLHYLAELRPKIELSAVYKKLALGTKCVDTTQKIEGLPIGSSSFLTFSHSCCLRSRISSSSISETNETPLILQLCNLVPRVFHLALFGEGR